jgi:ribosomal protein L20
MSRSNIRIVAPKNKSGQGVLFDPALADPARKGLTDEEKEGLRKDWLAPAGSPQERRILKRWATQKGLNDTERALIHAWINKPDGFGTRNEAFWRTAKKSVLGGVIYDTAMERHKKLNWNEWIVACLTTQGIKQSEIADLLDKSERTVDGIVLNIKQKIFQDLDCDIESVNSVQIARWFLGL